MEEKKKEKIKDNSNGKSIEENKLSETIEKAKDKNVSYDFAEEEVQKALKKCYKLIEDIAGKYLPVNADPAKKIRLISLLKNNAKVDFRNRLENQGIENLEKIVQDTAMDNVKPIVPVEDKGVRPVSREEARREALNRDIEKSFYESMSQEEKSSFAKMEFDRASRDLKVLKGNSSVMTDWDRAYMARHAIWLAELSKKGDPNALSELNTLSNELGFGLTDIDSNGNLKINNEKFSKMIETSAKTAGMDVSEFESDALNEFENEAGLQNELLEKYDVKNKEVMSQDDIDKLIKSMNSEKSPETTPPKSSSKKILSQDEIDILIKNMQNEQEKEISIEEQFSNAFSKDGKEFSEEISKLTYSNPIVAQKLLKELVTNNQSISGFQDKIMFMQEAIKQAEKDRLREAFTQNDGNFKETIQDLVKINPIVAKEFLKEFVSEQQNTNINNYDLKVMSLNESINEAMDKPVLEKTTSKEKNGFPSVEQADISAIIEDNGPSITGKTQNNSNNKEDKSQEDDELSL